MKGLEASFNGRLRQNPFTRIRQALEGRYSSVAGFKDGSYLDFKAEIDLTSTSAKRKLRKLLTLVAKNVFNFNPADLAVLMVAFSQPERVEVNKQELFDAYEDLLDELEITAIEYKYRGSLVVEESVGLDLRKKVKLKLNFSGEVTTTVDRPIYERIKDGNGFKNAYSLDSIIDRQLVSFLDQFIKPNDSSTKDAGLKIFKTFYFS